METRAGITPAERSQSLLPTALVAAAFLAVAIAFCASTSWYLTFKAVHVGFAVLWVGGGFLLVTLGLFAERSRDAHQLAAIARQAAFVGEKIFSPLGVIVLLAGVAMMVNAGWDWNQFWVAAGLVGFGASFVTGAAVLGPRSKRVATLIDTAGVEAHETQAAIHGLLLVARFDMALLLLVVVDMVVKPFS